MSLCPCGSGRTLNECCERYITGGALAPTAEAMMRARYSSYATGRVDFIESTQAPEGREGFDRIAALKWARESEWKGLQILSTEGGGEQDAEGVVSFVASYALQGREHHHEEIARFRKEEGAWLFVDGHAPKPTTYVKSGPDLGRNDPCYCGSGKKFKKCHGRSGS